MATTKIWPVRGEVGHVLRYVENKEKTQLAILENYLLEYIGQEEKTDAHKYVTSINCATETARENMERVKRQYNKTGGVVAFHAYQSFAPSEVTPEQAHQIGIQLAHELWGDRFQVVVATHLDKKTHFHNHFVINSVSFVDGKRFHSDGKFLRHLREVSDRICLENGLSVVKDPKPGKTRNYAEHEAEKAGHPTWRSTIKADIDHAIASSRTDRHFFDALRRMGYDYKIGQDISVRPPGKERFFRLTRNLGEDYTMENIRRQFGRDAPAEQKPLLPQPLPVKRHYWLKGKLPKGRKSRLRCMYLYYCYRLGVFKKHPQSPARMHFLLREDLKNLDKYTREIRLLHIYRIDTDVQLLSFQAEKQKDLDSLIAQRQKLRNKLRRMTDPEKIEATKEQIEVLTKTITKNRKEVKLCSDIYTRSAEIARKLEIIHRDESELRKEEMQHGYQRTGR